MDDGIVSEESLVKALRDNLKIDHLVLDCCFKRFAPPHRRSYDKKEVQDVSGGCGAKFELVVISPDFEGNPLLERHRMVNDGN